MLVRGSISFHGFDGESGLLVAGVGAAVAIPEKDSDAAMNLRRDSGGDWPVPVQPRGKRLNAAPIGVAVTAGATMEDRTVQTAKEG